jgi:hypothetical protein
VGWGRVRGLCAGESWRLGTGGDFIGGGARVLVVGDGCGRLDLDRTVTMG